MTPKICLYNILKKHQYKNCLRNSLHNVDNNSHKIIQIYKNNWCGIHGDYIVIIHIYFCSMYNHACMWANN